MPPPALTKLPLTLLRAIYRALPRRTRAWLRIRINWLSNWISDRLNHNNQLALMALMRNRKDCRFSRRCDRPAGVPVDISIVTYNSSHWIDLFFDSLRVQQYPLNLVAVYAVDNGSIDGTHALLGKWQAELGPRLRSFDVMSHANNGFGTSHNFAISRGSAEFVLVTNPDIKFEPESLSRIVARALTDAGAVASWELRQKPYEHPKHYDPVTLETNWSSHACVLLRRSAWEAIGGYDESIFMYAEDVEYSYRLRRAGYRLRYCPDAVVWHYSYDSIDQPKPLQYIGSITGNLHIRLRYGRPYEVVLGLLLTLIHIFFRQPFPGARRRLLSALTGVIAHAPAVLSSRRSTPAHFPLRRFDYEMARNGAFLEQAPSPDKPPLVSIVTRTHRGRAHHLRNAAHTILNQTYSNLEWILVEDGGDTMTNLVRQIEQDVGIEIRYFAVPKSGRSAAGNEGLRQARGEMVMFLDDDDLLYADHVEVLVNALIAQPRHVAAYSLALRITTKTDQVGEVVDEHFDTPFLLIQPYCYDTLRHHNYIPIQSILFRQSLYLERGGFDEELEWLEDWNLWLRYGYKNQFLYVPKTTSLFRVPADLVLLAKRQKYIDSAISDAIASAERCCLEYDHARCQNAASGQSTLVPSRNRPQVH